MNKSQSISFNPWKFSQPPKRILFIRLQAVGDTMITLPFVQLLKNNFPKTQIDFLTRKTQVSTLLNIAAINQVIEFDNSHRLYKQISEAIRVIFKLFFNRYNIVIDLQNMVITRPIRWFLFPKAWTSFEVFAPFTSFERNWQAIKKLGLISTFEHPKLSFKNSQVGLLLLKENGWDGISDLVVLNPAGAFKSRNWELKNYVTFAKIWREKYPNTQFLVLGDARIEERTQFFTNYLGNYLINLAGKTTLEEAFVITSKAALMISEDSGLLHIAWALKIQTIALIGSTHKDLSVQPGEHIIGLTSDDLPCGNCMKSNCQFGEIPPCLSRYSPEMIVELAEKLILKKGE